ncbi:hypothetical protein CWI84_01430 [Idiomarina tyrosinivorans]|uniref:VWA domain-containing protein n=1 Tax=Idiomarina tyrosinivorans TaxID=1445662 RepID=A0A432ZU84_9GAMM|nr:VWA domain-containing protein [Idiomarina tyrosinivorans]RUO81449.1 hypothetical protein CWI84_01430 [Idiomarina tyrosinivorans]
MFIGLLQLLKRYGVAVSITELLDLLAAVNKGLAGYSIESFYYLARTILVKDEGLFDRFDQAFYAYLQALDEVDISERIPNEWLSDPLVRQLGQLDEEVLKQYESLEQLLEQFKQRLEEQQERHQGGSKWIGTGGTSPFGAYGYHPGGIRLGQASNRQFSASKVLDKRQFADLDRDAPLQQRGFQVALRKLRAFARSGAATELDLDATIKATGKQGGLLDLQWRPERHNATNVLILFDVGGSMDSYIEQVEQLFSAASDEFKNLQTFYFHNCVYEAVWPSAARRGEVAIPTGDLVQRFGSDYKLIFVGDATMGPYEILYPGGSVEHWNEEPGAEWLNRLTHHFSKAVWLNPQPQQRWRYYPSINIIQELMQERMFPLTLNGIEQAIEKL